MDAARQPPPSFTVFRGFLKFMSTELVMLLSHTLCSSLLLPSVFSSFRVFYNESALHVRWLKYWNFSFSISPSNKYSRLISLGLTGLISLHSKGLSRVFSSTTIQKHQFCGISLLYGPTLTSLHDYWTIHRFDYTDFLAK